jgi:menaquinone-dependent protoporphyrinogen IX oxidase
MKTLIVYGTRSGWTRRTAEVLQSALSSDPADSVDMYHLTVPGEMTKAIADYDLIIAGSSIVAGFWKAPVKRFLRKYGANGQRLAVFVTAGGTMELAAAGKKTKEEAIQQGRDQYIQPFLAKHNLKAISTQVFGGQYGKEPKVKFNNWKEEDARQWAEELRAIVQS